MSQSVQVAIIKSVGANFTSIEASLRRLGAPYKLSDNPEVIGEATHVILPGVGSAAVAMRALKESKLDQYIGNLKKPTLGICLGMQLLCDFSEEGNVDCLAIIPLQVKKITAAKIVPHMGWNNLYDINPSMSNLFKGIGTDEDFYFVHSYAVELSAKHTLAKCFYGAGFSAAICRDNFFGVQFHPEKSGKIGEKLLANFLTF